MCLSQARSVYVLVRSGEVLLRGHEQSSLEQYSVDAFTSLLGLPFIFSGACCTH